MALKINVNGVDRGADVDATRLCFRFFVAGVGNGRPAANGLNVDCLAVGRQFRPITNSSSYFRSALYLACSANTLNCQGAWSMKRPGPTSSLPSRS